MSGRGTAFDSPREVSQLDEHFIEIRASRLRKSMQDMTLCSNTRLRSPQIMLAGSGAVGAPESIGLAE